MRKEMEIQLLSKMYQVRKVEEKDVEAVFQLCKGNPQYYQYCPPAVSREGIKADMQALPEGKDKRDKYYLGFWNHKELIAVMDLILGYPDEKTAFIGFFMMNAKMQGQGIGSGIVEEVCAALKKDFEYVRLGYVKDNRQSECFWLKNHFCLTGRIVQQEKYEVVVMQLECTKAGIKI